MQRQFSAQRGPVRVVFGERAAAALPAEITAERVLILCTPGRAVAAKRVAEQLGARSVGVIATAREHVPIDTAREARAEAERTDADAVLAIGGGSAIGLAKAIALALPVRVIAVPTTYSGSEMTPMFGISEGGEKKTGRDERVRPTLVVYDPTLTWGLPRQATIPSLWNAMAHAAQALWSAGDPSAKLTAEEALRLLSISLLRLARDIDDKHARSDALEGAYLAGAAFGDVGAGLHHKLCHVLGGQHGLPHAPTHAVMLPHVAALMARSEAMARALGAVDPVRALFRLAHVTGAPTSLASLGMPRDSIARVVETVHAAYPRFERAALTNMLERAWVGTTSPAPSATHAPAELHYQPGLGSTHESEALPEALPRRQNAPRLCPYGLYPELVNGTPFTVRSAENSRVWMYRVRPSFSHSELEPLPSARFAAELVGVDPNRRRWKPLPIPKEPERVDFLDGLVTLGGSGPAGVGPGYRVHLYAANASMGDRCFADADGDLLIVPQFGTLECRTELGWLRAEPGKVLLIPRAIKFAIALPEQRGDTPHPGAAARGWVLEVFGRRLRLPERGPIGSNGMADARHFMAPTASFEDRTCAFELVTQLGGSLYVATQEHSPFDVVAWHGNHVPFVYDLSMFNAMGSVSWDHPDPSILTVLTAPLDDHGRATADFVVFPGRWNVVEHSFRPPFMHRNAASEVNVVIHNPGEGGGYFEGGTFVTPLLTAHGVSTKTYDSELDRPADSPDVPVRIPDDSLWAMFESALPFSSTQWARDTPLVDTEFLTQFEGMKKRFDPTWKPR